VGRGRGLRDRRPGRPPRHRPGAAGRARAGSSTARSPRSARSTSSSPTTPPPPTRTSRQLTAEAIDHTLAVNVRATLLLVQAFAAAHAGGPGGRVILLTSGQGRGPMARELPYVASKAALSRPRRLAGRPPRPARDHRQRRQPGPDRHRLGAEGDRRAGDAPRCRAGRWGTPDDAARLDRVAGVRGVGVGDRPGHRLGRRVPVRRRVSVRGLRGKSQRRALRGRFGCRRLSDVGTL
jgi:hypothetical protein